MKQKKSGSFTEKVQRIYTRFSFAIILAVSFIFFAIGIVLFTQFGHFFFRIRLSDYDVGRVAENDLTVDRDITYVDEEATRIRRDARENLVPPIYQVHDDIRIRSLEMFDQFTQVFEHIINNENATERQYLELQSQFPSLFTIEDINILKSYDSITELFSAARIIMNRILQEGVVLLNEEHVNSGIGIIELWRWREGQREKEEKLISEVISLEDLNEHITVFREREGFPAIYEAGLQVIIPAFVNENTFFDHEQTSIARNRTRQEVEPVVRRLFRGETIVRRGFIITEEDIEKIRALGQYTSAFNLQKTAGSMLFLLFLYFLGYIFFYWSRSTRLSGHTETYIILALAAAFFVISLLILHFVSLPDGLPISLIIPTALFTMLITSLISRSSALISSFLFSLLLLLISELNIYVFLFSLFSGASGSLVVTGANKRIDLMKAAIQLSGIQILVFIMIGFLQTIDFRLFLIGTSIAVINGFVSGILNMGFLPVIEHLLNIPTRFRLLELSDLNAAILKRMLTLAPGTYGHSVSVANLAETACERIGANAILARVGAYYHDIGKLDQPEYFIENQREHNKHDELKPNLSAAVIKSHVKIGVEKAKTLSLPQKVIDIIAQHHGNGVISYFYRRALEMDEKTNADDYTYSNNPPASKEAAVVMLADAVEAASRTWKKPTVSKLEKNVWAIIMDKFEQKQLNNCELSISDLEIVKRTFIQLLAGHFHSRIEYPKIGDTKNE
ncbi:MAG: HD family phosphohydrolase [Spirochaetia bacterium]